jgi:serine/threonine-protein kinase
MKIVFLSGPLEGNKYEIDRDISLGRDISNDICLNDPAVSLVHCQIYIRNNQAFIKDLGSTNGSKLNGERIVNSDLHDGDGLMIGQNKIRIEMPDLEPQPTAVGTVNLVSPQTVFLSAPGAAGDHAGAEGSKDQLSGNIFGSVTYFLKRKIASGGMGSVYEAEQLGAEGFIKKVAIKTILPLYAKKESFVSSFIGEARLVANLVHQNIVQIHHLGRHGDGYYIAMEYIDGTNLTDFMAKHRRLRLRTPVDIATFIASRICRGLEYAHTKTGDDGSPLKLVHRDVSPNNIMITREGEVKLTDFGVAKAAQFMEDDAEYLVGSVEYMSPEQADCGEVDGRSDLFSVGLVFYELLTGNRVFLCKDNDIDGTVERVKKAEIPDPLDFRNDLPSETAGIVMKCLTKDRSARYQSAAELSYDLEHSIYSKGYGPTISKLAKYIEALNTKYASEHSA